VRSYINNGTINVDYINTKKYKLPIRIPYLPN
jgi:hypothetical protein